MAEASKRTVKKSSSSSSSSDSAPKGDDSTLTSNASAAGVTGEGAKGQGDTSPEKVEGPVSLVAEGIREHEEQIADLRENGGKDYPNVNVTVEYPTPPPAPAVEGKEVDTEFVYVHHVDPMRAIPGSSPYLDDVERLNAEVQRAKAEGRKPDLKNPPSTQGTPLRTPASLGGVTIPEGAERVTLPVVTNG